MFLAIFANILTASQWILMMMGVNMCVLLADVPSDGYSIELCKLEKAEVKGQVCFIYLFIYFIF